jgi:predicted O-methyltransferase YrrM
MQKIQLIQKIKKLLGLHFSYFNPGHFYSTIPSQEDRGSYAKYSYRDINLNEDNQFFYLQKISQYSNDISFKDQPANDNSYHFLNRYFSYSDATILWCLLAYEKPRNIVEIGSGYSTACMLETFKYYNLQTQLLCIDIDFSRLDNLVSGCDLPAFKKQKSKVQNIDVGYFKKLKEGDILFVDSSHVSKKGSDLHFILFEVLPQLASGVIIHFHDVFQNFEYPQAWLDEGIFWNEQYLFRALLQNNNAYSILLFNDFLENKQQSWYEENLPNCLKPHEKYSVGKQKGECITDLCGQSLWLVKK